MSALNDADAFALGYVHAQDRLGRWMRRLVAGCCQRSAA
jgi:acyl-homoserine lactone acylase PvdQ